jgi:hypothetical protein
LEGGFEWPGVSLSIRIPFCFHPFLAGHVHWHFSGMELVQGRTNDKEKCQIVKPELAGLNLVACVLRCWRNHSVVVSPAMRRV